MGFRCAMSTREPSFWKDRLRIAEALIWEREKWRKGEREIEKQGRIHGNPVTDGWAGAVMQKSLGIKKCDRPTVRPTYRPTRQGVESRVRD